MSELTLMCPHCEAVADCLSYVRVLWRNNIQQGIAAWQQQIDFILSFEQIGEYPDARKLASLQRPHLHNALFQNIGNVKKGLDEFEEWLDGLLIEPNSTVSQGK